MSGDKKDDYIMDIVVDTTAKTVLISKFKVPELLELISQKAKYFSFDTYYIWKVDKEILKEVKQNSQHIKKGFGYRNYYQWMQILKHQSDKPPRMPFEQLEKLGMIEWMPTIETPCTIGPLRYMYFFKISEFKHFIKYMKHFGSTFKIGEVILEDLVFYDGEYKGLDNVFFSISSHDSDVSVEMSKKEYEFLLDNGFIIEEISERVIPEE